MRLTQYIELNAGGEGSGCNPEVGVCGRPAGSGYSKFQKEAIATLDKMGYTKIEDKKSKGGFPMYKAPDGSHVVIVRKVQWKTEVNGKYSAHGSSLSGLKKIATVAYANNKYSGVKDAEDVKSTPTSSSKLSDQILQNAPNGLTNAQISKIDEFAEKGYTFLKMSLADGSPILKWQANSEGPVYTVKVTPDMWHYQVNGIPKGSGENKTSGTKPTSFVGANQPPSVSSPKPSNYTAVPKSDTVSSASLNKVIEKWKGGGQNELRSETLDFVNGQKDELTSRAKVLLNGIADGEKIAYPLYRGVNLTPKQLADWKNSYAKSEFIRYAPSGFSSEWSVAANKFGGNVQMFLSPGAKAIVAHKMPGGYESEKEHITAGEFKVTHIFDNPNTGKTEIYMAQVATFKKIP